jgi:4-amino-4-deoxy-L-arabinose transferase-like glycosyltransferase
MGFSEKTSRKQVLHPGDNIFTISAPAGTVTTLRLDLTHYAAGSFNIESVEFRNSLSFPRYSLVIIAILSLLLFFLIYEMKEFQMKHLAKVKNWIMQHPFIVFYSVAIFLVYSLWSLVTPYHGAPDEALRYDLVKYIAENGKLPVGGDPVLRNGLWGFSYAYLPYTTQIIGGFLVRMFQQITFDSSLILYVARIPSILSGVGTTIFTYKIGKALFHQKWAVALTILVSLWPQNAMISAYINNDAFALFAISIIIYAWILGLRTNWNLKSCITLGVGAGLCLISYYNAFIFLVFSAVIWLWSVVSKKENRKNLKKYAAYLGIMVGTAILIGGWFYIRNAVLYDGDFLGLTSMQNESELYAREELKLSNRVTFQNDPNNTLSKAEWVKISYRSFVAMLGQMDISVPDVVYHIMNAILCVGLLASLFASIHSVKQKKFNFFYMICAVAIPSAVALSYYHSYFRDYQPQGRYFLTILVALAILVTYGFSQLEKRFKKTGGVVCVLLVGGLVIAHVCSFFTLLSFNLPTQNLPM